MTSKALNSIMNPMKNPTRSENGAALTVNGVNALQTLDGLDLDLRRVQKAMASESTAARSLTIMSVALMASPVAPEHQILGDVHWLKNFATEINMHS